MNIFLLFILLSGFNSGGIFHLFFTPENQTKKETPINPNKMKISVGAGLSYGIGDIYNNTDSKLGFTFGIFFQYNLRDDISVETNLNYTYYKGGSTQNYDYNYGMLEILMGTNFEIIPQLGILSGVGIYRIMFTGKYTGPDEFGQNYDASETYLGLWGGISYSLSESFSIRATLHLPDFEPDAFYLRLNAVYSFAF